MEGASLTILSTINYPDDLRKLSIDELYQLADEIRETIINTVSSNGGHLAPNLGVVELTIAIHYALNTPEDKLIFDVGHQCYAHKIITGRRDVFSTLRQKNGISGFCNKNESIYDINITGHASNSISLALGIASARDIQHEKYHVAVVIGDGALTGGMALEALNQAGDSETPLIVILNDNQHSINGNVGALSQHLSHIRATKSYNTLKLRTRRFIKRIPCLGNILTRLLSSLKNGIKSLFVSGGMFFENLGFIYLGPINGHDIGMTIEMIQKAKRLNKPVLLHIRTRKGYGYLPAEIYPDKWHGTEPFSVLTGEITTPKRPGFTNIFSDEICLIAEKDKCSSNYSRYDSRGWT